MRQEQWFKAKKGEVHQLLLDHVRRVEQDQFDLFDRFVKLAALYDPHSPWAVSSSPRDRADQLGSVSENVIASNVDTVTAAIAASEVRARFLTDGADWATQRLAKALEWYAEELAKRHGVDAKCQQAFGLGAAVKGTGLVYVDVDPLDQIVCQVVPCDDVIVDERECRGGRSPRQLHWRRMRDVDELIAEFPSHEEVILAAQGRVGPIGQKWAGYRVVESYEVVTVHSWVLPIGKRGSKGYKPGREVISIDGADLLDREYHEDCFPFARIVWTERMEGWYGIGLAERIAGHQRTINRSNLQIERMVDQNAFITTFVRPGDAGLAAKQVNKIGTIAVYKDEMPKQYVPPAVHPEMYKRVADVKASAYEESGVSRMAAQAVKPAGLDSGRALREYRDQTTQRFAMQEKAYERLKLDVMVLLLKCCKRLGKNAPEMTRTSRFGARKIQWSKVEPAFLKSTIAPASNLNRTAAGREQTLIEWAQAGVISTDDFRRLINHPDLERAMSLYTAAMEDIDHCLDEIADGYVVVPEPYMNLAMAVWRGQQQYLLWRDPGGDDGVGAPEEVLEALRQFVTQAADMIAMSQEQQAMAAPAGAPMGAPPQAALAPQAMELVAG